MSFFKKVSDLAGGVVDGVKDGIDNVEKKAEAAELQSAIDLVRKESAKAGTTCLCCDGVINGGTSD